MCMGLGQGKVGSVGVPARGKSHFTREGSHVSGLCAWRTMLPCVIRHAGLVQGKLGFAGSFM